MSLEPNQVRALRYLAQTHPTVDPIVTADATFWDSEIDAAYVHWRTAQWLRDHGYVTFELVPGGDHDETALRLTPMGRARAQEIMAAVA